MLALCTESEMQHEAAVQKFVFISLFGFSLPRFVNTSPKQPIHNTIKVIQYSQYDPQHESRFCSGAPIQ